MTQASVPYAGQFRIFDAQTHITSEQVSAYRSGPHLRTLWPVNASEHLVTLLDETGVDKAVALTPCLVTGGEYSDPNHERSNEFIAQQVKKYPSRLIGAARVNPNYGPRAVEMLEHAVKVLGLRALKLHPMCEFFYPSHPFLPPLFEVASQHHIPVLIHTDEGPLMDPTGFLDLAQNFPKVQIILYHLSAGANAVQVAKRAANVHLETSFAAQVHIVGAVRALGAERVIFGSDAPFNSPVPEIMKVTTIPDTILPRDAKQKILGGNLARLFNVDL
jgi:predicted TIM-barrel fold metal-dependent hydrolase